MKQWEYLTVTLEANVAQWPVPISDDLPTEPPTKFAPGSLMPRLNELGAKGWELVSFEPVMAGRNGDVALPSGGPYARHYLCVFKRSF